MGKDEDVSREVEFLMNDMPIHRGIFGGIPVDDTWEGPVRRNRVTILEKFAAGLLNAEMPEDAESVAWKAVLEYHIPSRVLELIHSWELMYFIKASRQSWDSAFEITKILAAHGAKTIREPQKIDPLPYNVNPSLFKNLAQTMPSAIIDGLSHYYQSTSPEEYRYAADTLSETLKVTENTDIKHKLENVIHRSLIEARQRPAARKFFGKVWGRDPSSWILLEQLATPQACLEPDNGSRSHVP